MKAVKENKEYTITEADVESFRKNGFDIFTESGELVAYGAGKKVSYEKYQELLADYEALMSENADLTASVNDLIHKNAELEKKVKEKKATKKKEEKDV